MQEVNIKQIITLMGVVFLLISIGLTNFSSVEGKEYKTTAKMTKLYTGTGLPGMEGKEVNVFQAEVPPGWIGGKHYHSGDVLVYVLEGSLTIDLEGKGPVTMGPREVFHEKPNQVMQAKNASATNRLKALMFQVGPEGMPLELEAK
jgi:quercetin dioxygenase-like cupin family protein